MDAPIAKLSLFGKRAGEEPFEITAEIGAPYKCGDDPEEWACPLSLKPLFKHLSDASGGNSLQALCMAISLVENLLWDFRDKGGRLGFEPGSDDFPLQAYSFKLNGRE